MHPVYQQVILLWFTYTINYIQTEEITISGRTITLRTLFPKSQTDGERSQVGQSGGGWTTVLNSIAKEGVFGTVAQTDKVGLFDILLYLYDEHQAAQKLKQKSTRHK